MIIGQSLLTKRRFINIGTGESVFMLPPPVPCHFLEIIGEI
jgi:hypothetical protein